MTTKYYNCKVCRSEWEFIPEDYKKDSYPAKKCMAEKYQHEQCPTCMQNLSYELEIDKGTTEIVKGVARAIKEKGINCVHIAKEVLAKGYITVGQRLNVSRPKAHGLIAKVKGQAGNYCLTDKGLSFLKGEPIPRLTIIKKATRNQASHVIAHSEDMVTISQIDNGWGTYWSANGYDIKEGRVITTPAVKSNPEYQKQLI